ncbi:ESPR-type extended signal peptide-containing protein, partial [uncultured Megasphaera sp.]|uniref:ESPR-type extended signal peptide-containing protein n=1 Tax=uncultured Megasphaera sp. TaxID=165188 RepID=UPI0025962ECE
MNRIFKVIWSETKHAYCVVSEIAHTHSRASTRRTKAVLAAVLILTSSALGQGVQADWAGSYGAGDGAQAQGDFSTALGTSAKAQGGYSVAVGTEATTNAYGGTAVGYQANAKEFTSVALGHKAQAQGESSVALGSEAIAEKIFSMALGQGAKALVDGSIALGKDSIASIGKGVVGYDPFAGKASTENSAIWKATQAALSVGSTVDGNNLITRQITGVAAGTQDTDAVNVAQLKALNTKVDKGAVHYFSVKST